MPIEPKQLDESGCATTYVFPVLDPLTDSPIPGTTSAGECPVQSEHTTLPGLSMDQVGSRGVGGEGTALSSHKVPLHKTFSLDTGTSDFAKETGGTGVGDLGSEAAGRLQTAPGGLSSVSRVQAKKPLEAQTSGGAHPSAQGADITTVGSFNSGGPFKLPPKSALKKGHSRSASHGGVMGPRPGMPATEFGTVGAPGSVAPLHSALKKGHTRAASHGQIVDDLTQGNLKGHSRAPSKTDFILPPGHAERARPSIPTATWERGHSRQASRSESIYTLTRKASGKRWFNFCRSTPTEDSKIRVIKPNHLVPPGTPDSEHPNGKYPNNHIRTTKYTAISFLPKNLFEQFHRFANLYFIFIVLLNWIPIISAFGKEIAMLPVIFVLGVTAIKDLFEDRRRHLSDKRINNSTCRVYCREKNRFIEVKWKEMKVGDCIHLSNDEMIPADILILKTSDPNGLCYIETMNLDGESNLKQRQVIRDYVDKQSTFHPSEFTSDIHVGAPTTKIYHFSGNIIHPNGSRIAVTKENLLLRDCKLKNTDSIEGIVVYAGRETKAMLNNGGPRHKRTGLEKMMNLEVMWCVVILAIMCIVGATGSSLWFTAFTDPSVPFAIHVDVEGTDETPHPVYEAFFSFLTFIIILQVTIPLSLYVTIELTKLMQIYHIQNDIELYDPETNKRIECRAMNIPEDLGQIQYIFSDKTGTLTENKMMFRRCTIGAIDYNHSQPTPLEEMTSSRTSQNPPLKINPTLNELLGQLNIQVSVDSGNMEVNLTAQAQRVHDFFMILAACNTVVVAKHPHHDKMTASGLIEVESSSNILNLRLSPICEADSRTNSIYSCQDQGTLLHEDSDNSLASSSNSSTPRSSLAPSVSQGLTHRFRRPGKLDLLPQTRPLSPISSSNETTPTESPAQRPRKLPLPAFVGFRKTLNITNNQPPVATPTPSPSEIRPIYEAESPDELALVEAAYAYNCRLLQRTPKHLRVAMAGEELVEYEILHTFPFDSVRKRMSIILKHPITGQIIMYCKGADSHIFPKLKYTSDREMLELIDQTQTNINNYAREGLRILVMARRNLSQQEYNDWFLKYNEAEADIENRDSRLFEMYNLLENSLELVGATGIEDRLQEGVPETIESLRKAGIVVWVLTGDKQETAVNIAYSCRLFTPAMDIIKLNSRSKESAERTINFYLEQAEKIKKYGSTQNTMQNSQPTPVELTHRRNRSVDNPPLTTKERALVVDGKTLTYILDQRNSNLLKPFLNLTRHCSSVLCCRATPLQKAFIVSSVKDDMGMRTLAIGDGANDVSMIQRADVGVGISGKEGMQAVMASDFAISKFKYLERLLLVHGHWCYDRLARMILYFFFKNAAFVFVIFWYQLLNGWSGSVMIDQMYLMVFNLFFTALPPMAIGIYDQDASSELLLAVPSLYRQGRLQTIHKAHSFWWNMLDALYASVVIFFMAYGAYKGSDVGMFEFGTTIVTSCLFTMLVNMAIEAKSWTVLHVVSVLGSFIIFYVFAFTYNSICKPWLGVENPCKVINVVASTLPHWLTVFVTVVLAVLPRLVYRVLQNSLYPSDVTKALLAQRNQSHRKDEECFVAFSRSSSSSSVSKGRISCLCWGKNRSSATAPTIPTLSS